jgi:hypothetical protein
MKDDKVSRAHGLTQKGGRAGESASAVVIATGVQGERQPEDDNGEIVGPDGMISEDGARVWPSCVSLRREWSCLSPTPTKA